MLNNLYSEMPLDTPHPDVVNVYNPFDYIFLAIAVIIVISVVVATVVIAKKRKNK